MTSPLFLLSGLGIILFSAVQGLWGPSSPWPGPTVDMTAYIGSPAEAAILIFCMTCLVVYLVASRGSLTARPLSKLTPMFILTLFAVTVIVSFFDTTIFTLRTLEVTIPTMLYSAHFVTPPLIMVSLCLLMQEAPARSRFYQIGLFLLAAVALGGLIYVREGKLVMFMLAALVFYGFRLFNFSYRQLFLAAMVAILIALAFVQIVQHTRWKVTAGPDQARADYSRIFKSKGVWRQTDTGYCLLNVLNKHAGEPFVASKQLFWVMGLVPRILWPDKPSLSIGHVYAVDYCSKPPQYLGNHSASITLLGQPLIQGGILGLVLHGGFLLLGLGLIEKLNANPASLSSVLVVALLPWLMDFDQDFALYIANAVKFGLVMAVLLIPVALIRRQT